MADAPRILGVPMRLHENSHHWILKDVVLYPGEDHWLWQVHFEGEVDAAVTDTREEAIAGIEASITRIREAANKLGT